METCLITPATASDPGDSAAITDRRCPLCGAAGGDIVASRAPWRLRRCADCELVYMPEIPSAAAIEGDFDWEAGFRSERLERWRSRPFARLWTGLVLLLKPSREGRAVRRIARVRPPPATLLDIGAGDGRLAAAAADHGYDVQCVELSPAMVRKALRRVPRDRIHLGRLADAPFRAHSFDLVTAISYLEHEPDPAGLLRRVRDLLKPRGQLVIKVPNYASLLRRLRGVRWSGFRWPEHLQYFTPRTLSDLLTRAGAGVTSLRAPKFGDNMWLSAAWG